MRPPILLLISTDPHARPLLEQALDHRRATILAATTTEEGLRILNDQADFALVLCDESGGQIASQVILSQARRIAQDLPVIILGTDGSAKARSRRYTVAPPTISHNRSRRRISRPPSTRRASSKRQSPKRGRKAFLHSIGSSADRLRWNC